MPPGGNIDKANFRIWLLGGSGGGEGKVLGSPTEWLPTERVANAWRAMVTEQPNEANHE